MRVSDQNIDRPYVSSQARSANYKMVDNHYHYYYELYYLKKGTCRFFTHEDQYTLHAGDFIILPPREVHFNRYLSACLRINVYFRLEDLLENNKLFLPHALTKYTPSKVTHIPSGSQAIIETTFNKMLAEEKINDEETYIMMPLLLKSLFIDFDRFGTESSAEDAENHDEIVEAVHYITAHYNLSLTLDSLADRANLSPTYFSKKFHQTTGMGMKEYLTYIRLNQASKELLSTNHTITQIAINSGFSNSNYFKDAFKKMYNVSPRQYRASRITDYKLEQALKEGK
jgi:AraC-like DNA-binding protein